MAKFVVGETLVSEEPVIRVDAGLPVGVHRFQLVVESARGRRSRPAEVAVRVRRRRILGDLGGLVVVDRGG